MIRDRATYDRAARVVKGLERRIKAGTATDEEWTRARAGREELAAYEWARDNRGGATEHTRLEVAAAVHQGRPLEPGEPVPGCPCPECTGVSADDPARAPRRRTYNERDPLPVEAARSVPITEVTARFGIETDRHGWALCPFHEDRHPSFHVNEAKGAAFCNPCGASWDGIALVMELRGLDFAEAVKELAAWAGWTERVA